MRVTPDRRLVGAALAWTALAVAAVVAPWLGLALGAFALAGIALVAWDAVQLLRAPDLELVRRAPERLAEGRPAQVELELRNPGAVAVEADVWDEVPRDLAEVDPHFAAVRVGAREARVLRYAVEPRLRGDRALGPAAALRRSPLGFWRRRTLAGAGETLRVHPDATRFLRPEALDPKRVLPVLGVRPSRRRGEGMDFESLRDYVPGDDPRRIDWRATARRGRPVVRLYQHERNHTVVIAVDASRLMGGRSAGRTKLDWAVDASLALAYAALASGDRVGLAVFDTDVRAHLAPRARRGDLGAFIELLTPVHPRLVEADYRALVRSLVTHQQRRALVVVLTDFVEADAPTLVAPLALLGRHHRVLLVALRDRAFDPLDARAPSPPADRALAFRRVVLDDLLREREETLARLRRAGLHTLDLVPQRITAGVLNRYLELRYGREA